MRSSTTFKKGHIVTSEMRRKIGLKHRGKVVSEETREKIRNKNIGKKLSDETRRKQSLSAIRHMIKVGRTYLTPNIGIKEKEILDYLEKELKYKILRQYRIGKYFVDGYIQELNLVIEIDEMYHHKNKKEYDIKRQDYIQNKLNCYFFRLTCV